MLGLDSIPGTLAVSQESTLDEKPVHDTYLGGKKRKKERNITA